MQKPANPKLYAMIVAQAKAKYATYPSPGASHWVHSRYEQLGGQFTETTEEDRKMKMAVAKHNAAKKKRFESKGDKKGEKKKDKK